MGTQADEVRGTRLREARLGRNVVPDGDYFGEAAAVRTTLLTLRCGYLHPLIAVTVKHVHASQTEDTLAFKEGVLAVRTVRIFVVEDRGSVAEQTVCT